jgi:hypothetical protein
MLGIWLASAIATLTAGVLGLFLSWHNYDLYNRLPDSPWSSNRQLEGLLADGAVRDPGYLWKELGMERDLQFHVKGEVAADMVALVALSALLLLWSCYAAFRTVVQLRRLPGDDPDV